MSVRVVFGSRSSHFGAAVCAVSAPFLTRTDNLLDLTVQVTNDDAIVSGIAYI